METVSAPTTAITIEDTSTRNFSDVSLDSKNAPASFRSLAISNENITGTELFSLFTADIMKKETLFIR